MSSANFLLTFEMGGDILGEVKVNSFLIVPGTIKFLLKMPIYIHEQMFYYYKYQVRVCYETGNH